MLLEHPEVNLENARRVHHEYYAPALVNNWWLRLFCAGLVLALVVQGAASMRTAKQIAKQRVIVLGEARDGSFDRVQYVAMTDLVPNEKELEHFAYVWAVKYYSRNRATIGDDFPASLQFFAPDIVKELNGVAEQTKWVQEFQDSAAAEVRIVIKKIRLDKGAVTIDFEKHFYLNGREAIDKAESWTAQVPYELLPAKEVTNGMIPINPIGLRMTALPLETKGF